MYKMHYLVYKIQPNGYLAGWTAVTSVLVTSINRPLVLLSATFTLRHGCCCSHVSSTWIRFVRKSVISPSEEKLSMYTGNKIYTFLTTALRWRWQTSVSLRKL